MNLGPIIALFKLLQDSGIVSPKDTVTPPSSKAGLRPDCGPGKKAILQNDQWVCVPKFDQDPCANMTPGSPAWLACKESQQ